MHRDEGWHGIVKEILSCVGLVVEHEDVGLEDDCLAEPEVLLLHQLFRVAFDFFAKSGLSRLVCAFPCYGDGYFGHFGEALALNMLGKILLAKE